MRVLRSLLVSAALVAGATIEPVHAANTAYLAEPDPVEWSCELDVKAISGIVGQAGERRGWQVLEQGPGAMKLRYVKGDNKHILDVEVRFDDEQYRVRYFGSANLNYRVVPETSRQIHRAGAVRIHPRVNGWMANLSRDIRKVASKRCR